MFPGPGKATVHHPGTRWRSSLTAKNSGKQGLLLYSKPELALLAGYGNALTERRFHKHGQKTCSLTCEDIDLSHLTPEKKSIGNLGERGDTLNRVLAVRQEYLYHRQPKDYRL